MICDKIIENDTQQHYYQGALLTDPTAFFQQVGVEIKDLNLIGINIPMFFLAGDLNSIVFKSENSVEIELILTHYACRMLKIKKGSQDLEGKRRQIENKELLTNEN